MKKEYQSEYIWTETYTYDDFLNYNPQEHTPFFWKKPGITSHIDRQTDAEWDTIFSAEDFEKAQLVIRDIYNKKIFDLLERLKINFKKRWDQSKDKERLVLKEINNFGKLLFEEELDLTNYIDESKQVLELRLPFISDGFNNSTYRPRQIHSPERFPRAWEECPTVFYPLNIKRTRTFYNEIIVNGEKDYSRTAPNSHHFYHDIDNIEVEVYHQFYNWLKYFKNTCFDQVDPNTTSNQKNDKEDEEAFQSLDKYFSDPDMIKHAIDILKQLDPPVINEIGRCLIKKHKTVFKLWLDHLSFKGITKKLPNDETLARLLEAKFKGLKLAKDGSTLRKVTPTTKEKYEHAIKKAVIDLSSHISPNSQK